MSWILFLVGAAILGVLFVPLLAVRESWGFSESPDRLRHVKRARDRALRTIKDLENDFREGTLAEDDYNELRIQYKSEAVALTKELHRVRETVVRQIASGPRRPLTDEERKTLEGLVGRRKKKYVSN